MAQAPVLRSINPGDKLPDIAFNNMLNYKSSTAKLSDFKGKLVILDFWATWCGNCIKKFNLLDSLQRTNPGKLQVILINTADTRDTRERIERFLNRIRNPGGNLLSMPVLYDDTMLNDLFPHQTIPHYVWLNGDMELIAVTDATPVTAANIQKLINGQVVWLNPQEANTPFDYSKPFFTGTNTPTGSIQFRSTLLHAAPGLSPGSRFTKDSNAARYSIINMPLRDLVKTAYSLSFQKDRLILDVSDSMLPKLSLVAGEPSNENRYCYEFIGPFMPLKQVLVYMQLDMLRYFNLCIKTELRQLPCYVIKADSTLLSAYRTRGGPPANKLFGRDKSIMINQPLGTLTTYLDKILDRKVIQQTTIGFNIDLELPDTVSGDIEAIQTMLAKMGILLTASTEITEQQIIYQTPKQKLP